MLKIAVKGNFEEVRDIIREITGEVVIFNLDEDNIGYADIVVISEYTEKIPKCRFIISECIGFEDVSDNPYLVTCGTDSRATLTISAYTDIFYSDVQCCIQRTIYTLGGNEIDCQEFSVEGRFGDINVLLVSVAVGLINDIDINIIKKRLLKTLKAE